MVDGSLEEYKDEFKQLLFPIFSVLYLTQISKGMREGAAKFFETFSPLFTTPFRKHNQDLTAIQCIKSKEDLDSSTLDGGRYIKNKYHVKVSLYSKKVLLNFMQFEHLILLLQVINNNIEFSISNKRNIVDLKSEIQYIQSNQKLPQLTSSILLPKERSDEDQQLSDSDIELILGTLP